MGGVRAMEPAAGTLILDANGKLMYDFTFPDQTFDEFQSAGEAISWAATYLRFSSRLQRHRFDFTGSGRQFGTGLQPS